MGRNRKKSGAGAVEATRYDVFGNVIGETPAAPAPASVLQQPTPPAEQYIPAPLLQSSLVKDVMQTISRREASLSEQIRNALKIRNGFQQQSVRSGMRSDMAVFTRAQQLLELAKLIEKLAPEIDRLAKQYDTATASVYEQSRIANRLRAALGEYNRATDEFDRLERRPITDRELSVADQRLTIVLQMIDDAQRRGIRTPVDRIVEELTSTSTTRYEFGTTPPRQQTSTTPRKTKTPRKPRGGGLL
jgi:hypothetical protein